MVDAEPNDVIRPVEQLPIALFESVVLAVRDHDGLIYLNIRDLCAALNLNESSQTRRMRQMQLRLKRFRIRDGAQVQLRMCLLLDDLSIWLLNVQAPKANADAQQRLDYVKQYLAAAVREAFRRLTGQSAPTSDRIEDLRELDRIDLAFQQLTELGERQTQIETSQDRARQVFRDLATTVRTLQTRVQELEQQVKHRISPEQRGTIYRLVHQWADARASHAPRHGDGARIRRCWREFNDRFDLATYTDLPAARYDEAIQYLQQNYRALTGQDIDAIEQRGMELE